MPPNSNTILVACPQCGKPTPWQPDNLWRPFCSERCKLIDLGHWADDRYRLPEENAAEAPNATLGEQI
jgi:endogenous inhibitor of DNA gyrase (YacG/DUF329 family)